ncbi:MAG TPA: universal stress protein, partial [Vicinamibacteria bacterium]
VLDRPPAPVLLVPLGPVRAGWPAPGTRPRLLVPLDGSAFAEAALPLAGEVAAALGGEITLLRAVPPGGAAGGAVPPAPRQGARPGEQPPAPDGRAAEARAYLRAAADRLPAGAGAPQLAVRWGEPADAIAAEARERAVGLVVMATHGYTDPRRALLGSVAEAVVARCALPLLLLRPRTPRALGDAADAEGAHTPV